MSPLSGRELKYSYQLLRLAVILPNLYIFVKKNRKFNEQTKENPTAKKESQART